MITQLRDVYEAKVFAENYSGHLFDRLPCSDSAMDCFVVILSDGDYRQAAVDLVRANTDWIEVFGVNAESFHDLIDAASVAIGRQKRIGDGNPMTTWQDNLSSFVEFVQAGGQGANKNKLILFLGENATTYQEILSQLS